MKLPPDYHMHTYLCRHAVGTPREYAAQARKLGLTEIGFSDHSPMREDNFDDWRMRLDQLDEYVELVRAAQRDYPDLRIRLGLEIDFLPDQLNWIRDLSHRFAWDYFIGSVHYVTTGWDVDNPAKVSEWHKHDPWEVWSIYFERLILAVESGLFDIIGHADLPKKFCYYPTQDCTPLFQKFLNTAGKRGAVIELNTAGLRKECAEIYPSPAFLRLAHDAGVGITFGSDAHAPDEVGLNLDAAVALARELGFDQAWQFQQRQRQAIPIR
jgi:histidinol-phosphatase (PHP family)